MDIEINNRTRTKINLQSVKNVVRSFLKYYKIRAGEVSLAFVGDRTIRRLNKKYRGIDRVTDVLVFPDMETGARFSGEVIIDYQQVKRQARRFSDSVSQELIFVLVHGLLHLFGYEDKTEKGRREMEGMGEEFIKVISNK